MKITSCLIASLIFFGNMEAQYSEKKTVGDFSGIEVSSAARVNLYQSDSNYVILTYTDVIKKTPRLEVHGDALKVDVPFRGTISVYAKNISSIKINDAGRVYCKDTLKTNNLTIHVSDAGRADILVHAKMIKAKANDAASITLSGTADSLDIKSSDASKVNTTTLKAGSVRAISSDGSTVSVWAINRIDADASDGSNVHVKGTPVQKTISASDGGSVIMDESGDETTPETGRHSMTHILNDDSVFGKHRGDRQMVDAFVGFGFVIGGNHGAPVKYGNSREFIIGIGGGRKFCKWNGFGFDVYYKSTDFYLSQDSGKKFPDAIEHNSEKVSLQNFGGLLYDRFIFTSGYHGTIALDLGVYGDWTFNTRAVSWDDNDDVKTIHRNLAYFNHGNYGVTARFIFLRTLMVYCNYRLSNVFNTSAFPAGQSPALPAIVFGFTMGLDGER